jgi:REP element-mobilizing transposase RayT
MDPDHNAPGSPPIPPDPELEAIKASHRKTAPVTFDARRRKAIEAGIRATCAHRGWQVLALNVRTNHVHVVVDAAQPPERVMNILKSWATREMVTAGAIPRGIKAWSRHGSTIYLWTEEQVGRACDYVEHGQGEALG